jgi:hypothetical protein
MACWLNKRREKFDLIRFEVSTIVKIHIVIFSVIKSCGLQGGHQTFRKNTVKILSDYRRVLDW